MCVSLVCRCGQCGAERGLKVGDWGGRDEQVEEHLAAGAAEAGVVRLLREGVHLCAERFRISLSVQQPINDCLKLRNRGFETSLPARECVSPSSLRPAFL